jgi:hypothetical protein
MSLGDACSAQDSLNSFNPRIPWSALLQLRNEHGGPTYADEASESELY